MNRNVNSLKGRLEWGAFAGLVVWFYGTVALVTTCQNAYAAVGNAFGGLRRVR